jgi:HlyD family secretion protein
LPQYLHLGEQAEIYITTTRLQRALLVPEAAIVGLGKSRGSVWTVENGHLQLREVTFGYRLLDGRYEIASGLPDKAEVVAQLRSGLRAGRAAKVENRPVAEASR